MTGSSIRRLRWLMPLLLSPMVLELGPVNRQARAGLLQPLIRLLQPRVERHLVKECRTLADQAFEDLDTGVEPGRWLDEAIEQPCRTLARPVSECLIRETSNSGRELGVLTELLGNRVGDDATVVIKRCLASLIGLPASSLEQLPLQELEQRLRR